MNDEGVQRSAIVLLAIGEEAAAEVLRQLRPREVSKLGTAMTRLGALERDEVAQALRGLRAAAARLSAIAAPSRDYARAVLNRALGAEHTARVFAPIPSDGTQPGLDSLRWMEPAAVAALIRSEHPQVIATVLVFLDAEQASEILGRFEPLLRNDIILRIAALEQVQPDALRDLDEALGQLLTDAGRRLPRAGMEAAADILNRLSGTQEEAATAHIRAHDPALAERLEAHMPAFEDLLELDDKAARLLVRLAGVEVWAAALRGATEELRDHVLEVLPPPVAGELRDALEAGGPVRLAQVESAQRRIVRLARRLIEEGRVTAVVRSESAVVQ